MIDLHKYTIYTLKLFNRVKTDIGQTVDQSSPLSTTTLILQICAVQGAKFDYIV